MKNKYLLSAIMMVLFALDICAQEQTKEEGPVNDLPYYQIPDYPEAYTPETVAARVIDGLGFRFYWASEGLRPEDLSYKPSEEARTTEQTIDHILGLSNVILNAIKMQPNIRPREEESLTFEEKRERILNNVKMASNLLKKAESGRMGEYNMVFQNPERTSEFPFWNLLNGPIADAIWHTGQVVSFRRASGNPFNSNVSVLNGKLRD